ncbi:MAG: superoxide dismutase [Cu-Zn] SodC [Pseudomonadota bacterium]
MIRVFASFVSVAALGFVSNSAWADFHAVQGAISKKSLTVNINSVSASGIGDSIGEIEFLDGEKGLIIRPKLKGLSAGEHGFHIHQNPDCSPAEKDGVMVAAQAAGSHFDPLATGAHKGPHGGGHKGDLPKLIANPDGTSNAEMQVPGLRLVDIINRSVMIHAGGDNYSDQPAPLGGGGAMIACGVVK